MHLFLVLELNLSFYKQKIGYHYMLKIRVIGVLCGFGHGVPSKGMEIRVDDYSLLRRRYRSLFLVPLSSNLITDEKGVYLLLVQF